MQGDHAIPPTPPEPAPPETVGRAFSRWFGIFASPADVYEDWVGAKPNFANIFVPTVLAMFAAIVFVLVSFSQPAVLSGMKEAQAKQMEKNAKSQNLTPAQIEKQQEITEKFMTTTMLKIFGAVGATFGTIFGLVVESFFAWILLRTLYKTRIPFPRAVELTSLSWSVLFIGTFITLSVVVMTGSLYMNVGPSLFVKEFDPKLKLHQILSVFNVMTIWQLGVESIGIAKIAQRRFLPVALVVYSLWIALRSLMIFANPMNY